MPSVDLKESVLNGRGSICRYSKGSSAGLFFYREWNKEKRCYRSKVIEGASTMEEAKALAPQVAIELAQSLAAKPPTLSTIDPLDLMAREEKLQRAKEKLFKAKKKEENPKINLEKAFKDWFKQEQKRVDAGALAQSSFDHKFNCCRHIKFYLNIRRFQCLLKLTNRLSMIIVFFV